METQKAKFCQGRKCFIFPIMLIGLFIVSAVVMLLWNWILPAISTLPALTYWQSMGLLVLSRILFGSFNFRDHHRAHRQHTKQQGFQDKFMEMDASEKQQFKEHWKNQSCNK
jgi:hypothetical protein